MSSDSEKAYDIEVGAALRRARLAIRMSQEELAGRIGITFQQVQKYENGTNRVSVSRLRTICAALETTSAAFLWTVEPPATETSRQAAAILGRFDEARRQTLETLRIAHTNLDDFMNEAELEVRRLAGMRDYAASDEPHGEDACEPRTATSRMARTPTNESLEAAE